MKSTRSLRRAATGMEGRSLPIQEDNPIQGEAATMDMENGSPKLLCLRRRSGTRRDRFLSLILHLRLDQTTKSRMDLKRDMGIVSIPLLPVKEDLSVPIRRDMGRLDPSIVGSWLVVVLNCLKCVPLSRKISVGHILTKY